MSSRSLGTLTIDILAKTGNLTQGMSKAAREVDNDAKRIRRSLEQNVSQGANSATDALNRFSAQVISIAAAWRGLSAGISAADTWTNLNNRLRLVTDGQQGFVAAQENVLRIAKESRQPLEATAELYQRIATNQKELGLSGQGVADIVETISKAMVVSGTSAQGAQAALVQLGQAFASGTLRGEELNSVLEQAPALANAIAAGLGVPIGKLRELGKAGELTAEQVIGALQDQADEIDSAFSSMDATVSQAMTNVRTNLTELIGRFSEATGASSGLASAISALGNNLPQVATAFAAFASVKVSQQLADRVRVFRETQAALVAQTKVELANAQAIELKTRAALLDAQAEVRRAQAIGGSVAISAQAAQATLVHRQAVVALEAAQLKAAAATSVLGRAASGVLGFFGGPAGLAFMVATTAASWLLFSTNTDNAKRALLDFNGVADDTISKFRELNKQQQAGEILRLQQEMSDGFDDINGQVAQMANLISQLGVNANFLEFKDRAAELQEAFHAGRISADDFSQQLADLAREATAGAQKADVLTNSFTEQQSAIATMARDYDRQRGLLEEFTGAQQNAEAATDGNTRAIRDQASALAAGQKALSDYIGKMDQIINQGVVSLVRKTKGEFAALEVEVGQMIKAAGGVDALDPQQRSAINEFLETRREQIRLEEQYDKARKKSRGGRGGKSDAEREQEQLKRAYESMSGDIERRIELFGKEGEAARIDYEIQHGALQGLDEPLQKLIRGRAQQIDQMELLDELQRAADDAVKQSSQAYEAEQERVQEFVQSLKDEVMWLAATTDQRYRLEAAQIAGVDATKEEVKAIEDLLRQRDEMFKADRNWEEFQRNISDGFFDIITGAESAKDAIGNFLEALNNQILRNITDDWARGISDWFKGLSSAGGSGGGGFWSTIGSLISGFGGGRAVGGPVAANHLYRVNEQGPEVLTVSGQDYLLMGRQSGYVTPNRGLGSVGGITQQFYTMGLETRETRERKAQLAGREARRALARTGR